MINATVITAAIIAGFYMFRALLTVTFLSERERMFGITRMFITQELAKTWQFKLSAAVLLFTAVYFIA